MSTSIERTLVPVRGGHLHVQSFGEGRPLVLLHGLADHMGTWSRLLPLLPRDRRIILADLPGHGLSTRQGPFDADSIAARLHDAFDALGLDEVDVVAHSLGGAASIALAPRLGRRLARLALIAPAGLSSSVPLHLRVVSAAPLPPARVLQPLVGPITRIVAATPLAFYDADEARALAWANAAPGTLEAWLGTLRAHVSLRGLTPTIAERIEEIAGHGPALSVFFGDADPVIPAAHARTMMRAVANATVCVAPGLGHVPHRQAPEVVASWLREFLATEPVPVAPRRAVVVASGFRMPWYRRAARAVADFFRFGRPVLGS